jgi:uncharacterized phage protein gp47/JayE
VLEALPTVTRVTVKETTPLGTVRIRAATALGGITSAEITTITDYLNGTTDGKGRRPLGDVLDIASATVKLNPSIGIVISVDSAHAATVEADVTEALRNYFASLPIGGYIPPGGSTGYVLVSRMYAAVMSVEGVSNVTGLPAADIVLTADEIYSPAIITSIVIT